MLVRVVVQSNLASCRDDKALDIAVSQQVRLIASTAASSMFCVEYREPCYGTEEADTRAAILYCDEGTIVKRLPRSCRLQLDSALVGGLRDACC